MPVVSRDGRVGSVSGLLQFLPFALILAIFYFLILLPMKRRQKKVQAFQESLKVERQGHHDERHLRRISRA